MEVSCIKLLGFFIILSIGSAQNSDSKPQTYRAAVYEHKQYDNKLSIGRDIIDNNLAKYTFVGKLAKENDVQLLVYPEKGMFPMKDLLPTWFLLFAEDVPHGKEEANPCDDENFSDTPILRNFSCIAKENKIYIAANLIDKKKCEVHDNCEKRRNKNSCVTNILDCPLKGFYYFNAQVVFNKKGTLILRYYKRQPFIPLDIEITIPRYPQSEYFKTPFGIFSTEIGFDAVFDTTVNDVQNRPETTGVSYTNWWFDHAPFFYFGVPIQQALSLVNNVTILSSDVQAARSGSLGSGIYVPGKGALIYSYNPDGKSKLLISDVPTSFSDTPINVDSLNQKFLYITDNGTVSEWNEEEPRDFKEECSQTALGMTLDQNEYRCKDSRVDHYTFVKLNKTEDRINICSNGFCCSLEYEAESMDEDFYFAVSGKRLKFYQIYWFGIQSCFLARSKPLVGKFYRSFLLKSNTKFLTFKMKGNFDTDYVYPHVLDSKLHLTDTDEYQFDQNQLSYRNKRGRNLLHADMYGRQYGKDDLTLIGSIASGIEAKI